MQLHQPVCTYDCAGAALLFIHADVLICAILQIYDVLKQTQLYNGCDCVLIVTLLQYVMM